MFVWQLQREQRTNPFENQTTWSIRPDIIMKGVSVILAICSVAAIFTPVQAAQRELVQYGKTVSANPRKTINSEFVNHPNPNLKVQLKGMHDTETDFYYVAIEVTNIPIYQPTATPPAPGETIIPDNDDIENIQVYFANEEGRILEVRFNRFEQALGRLWKRPYHLLRDDVPVEISGVTFGEESYSMTVMVRAEALPEKMTLVHAVVVDPTKEGGDKYYTHYRLYNHPLGYDWNMKVYMLYKSSKLYDLVPEEINGNYSSWWDGR